MVYGGVELFVASDNCKVLCKQKRWTNKWNYCVLDVCSTTIIIMSGLLPQAVLISPSPKSFAAWLKIFLFDLDEVLAWLSVWSEVQMICIWSSWCLWHPVISCSSRIQNGLPLWCRLTQVVLEKRPVNRC